MSKSWRELRRLTKPGPNFSASSIAPSCWGITVPIMEVTARTMSSPRVNLTEVKRFHRAFDFFPFWDDGMRKFQGVGKLV
jgi:hypothetical protein